MKRRKIDQAIEGAKKAAEKLLAGGVEATLDLTTKAAQKAEKHKRSLDGVWSEFQQLLGLVKAYTLGEYRAVEWQTIVLCVAALLYFVNPFDIIPDFLVGGLIDDGMVLSVVFTRIQHELNKFRTWKSSVDSKR